MPGGAAQQNYQQGQDNRIRLWDAATGRLVREFVGHDHSVRCLTFTADGKRLVSGSLDKSVRLWDVATGKELSKVVGTSWPFGIEMVPKSSLVIAVGGAYRDPAWTVCPQERLRVFKIEEPPAAR